MLTPVKTGHQRVEELSENTKFAYATLDEFVESGEALCEVTGWPAKEARLSDVVSRFRLAIHRTRMGHVVKCYGLQGHVFLERKDK